jgi:hypothetical protein
MPILNPYAINNPYYALGEPQRLATGIFGHILDEGKKGVYIPTFYSISQGKGNAGKFIEELKERYNIVKFPNIINPVLIGMLERRGFKKKREYVPCLKTHAIVYTWKKR